jgi:hypothetical protein
VKSESKEIEVIDFENALIEYIPFNMKDVKIKNVVLSVEFGILIAKRMDSNIIKKVYFFQLSQISDD